MKRIHSKYSKQFHMKLRTLFNQIKTANIMLLEHLFVSQGHISDDPTTILPVFNFVFMMSNVY